MSKTQVENECILHLFNQVAYTLKGEKVLFLDLEWDDLGRIEDKLSILLNELDKTGSKHIKYGKLSQSRFNDYKNKLLKKEKMPFDTLRMSVINTMCRYVSDNQLDWNEYLECFKKPQYKVGQSYDSESSRINFANRKPFPPIWKKILREEEYYEQVKESTGNIAIAIDEDIKWFVPNSIQETPSILSNPIGEETMLDLIMSYIKHPPRNKFIFVMAGSGMGKTVNMLNLYIKHNEAEVFNILGKHYELVLLQLINVDSLEVAKSIENPINKIALLDGFDESKGAIEDYRSELDRIIEACAGFRLVVVTCRT